MPRHETLRVRVRGCCGPAVAGCAGVLGAAALLASPLARAQEAADDRAQSFKAVTGAVKEDVPGGPLLIGAYAALWVIVFALVFRLVRKQQRAENDLARLERVLQKADSPRSQS